MKADTAGPEEKTWENIHFSGTKLRKEGKRGQGKMGGGHLRAGRIFQINCVGVKKGSEAIL